jgi:hypothetical protein
MNGAELERAFDESRFEWAFSDGIRTVRVGSIAIAAHLDEGAVNFQTWLGRLGTPMTADALPALADFLSVVNCRLRFARAELMNDQLLLEAVVPGRLLTRSTVDRAVEALAIGAATIEKECAALLNGEMARRYLEFHNSWREHHADRNA